MKKFGKFINDIRKNIRRINILFEEVPFGETMTITVPDSNKKYVVDTRNIGVVEHNTPEYKELLLLTIEQLNLFVGK